MTLLTAPLWIFGGAFAACCAFFLWRGRRKFGDGQCSGCGYDLRACPGRCPECGRSPADPASPSGKWLAAERASLRTQSVWAAFGGAMGGLAVTAGIFAFVFMATAPFLSISDTVRAAICWGVVLLIFVMDRLADHEELDRFHDIRDPTDPGTDWSRFVPGADGLTPVTGADLKAGLRLGVGALFTGPRLFRFAARMLRKARRLESMDEAACAAVLDLLLARNRRTPLADVAASVPGLDPAKVFPQLADLDGVLFLGSGEPALALGSELREAIAAAKG